MKNKLNLISMLLVSLLVCNACKKEGCTNVKAENYQLFVKKDNNLCVFRGNVVLWYRESVYLGLAQSGVSNLSLFINGQLQKTLSVGVYDLNEPSCEKQNRMSLELDLGNTNSKDFDFEIKNQYGGVIWNGVINLSAKKCSSYELTL